MTSADERQPTSRSRKKAETRAAIVAAAIELFVERGVVATMVEEVARAAGVSKATLFFHFGSRTGLLTAVGEELFYRGAHGTYAEEPGLEPYLRGYIAAQRQPTARVLWELGDVAVAQRNPGPEVAYAYLLTAIETGLGADGVAAGHRAALARVIAPAALLIARRTAYGNAGDDDFRRFLDDIGMMLGPWR
jgi:AcrR family transcriptional regulator